MAQYDRQVALAKKLIAKYGETLNVQWVQPAKVDNVDTPWRSQNNDTSYDISIAFLPYARIGHDFLAYIAKTEVQTGTVVGYMFGGVPFLPALQDWVMRDGELYRIDDIDRLAPNGQDILWTIYFKR